MGVGLAAAMWEIAAIRCHRVTVIAVSHDESGKRITREIMRNRGVLKECASLWDFVLRVADPDHVALTGWLSAVLYIDELPALCLRPRPRALLLVQIVIPGFGLHT